MNSSDPRSAIAQRLAVLGSVSITPKGQLKIPRAVSATLTAKERALLAADREAIGRAVEALRALAAVEAADRQREDAAIAAVVRRGEERYRAVQHRARLERLAQLSPKELRAAVAAGRITAEEVEQLAALRDRMQVAAFGLALLQLMGGRVVVR